MEDVDLGKKLRHLRKEKRLTLKEVAEKAQLSESFLSQVERGVTSPSISSLKKIGGVLGATVASFFESGDEKGNALVFRKGETEGLESGVPKTTFFLLGPRDSNARIAPYLIKMEPGSTQGPQPYSHEGEEFGLVLEGRLEIKVSGKGHLLEKGDSIYFNSSLPHGWKNKDKKTAVVIWVCSPSTF